MSDLISRSALLEQYGLKDAVKYGNKNEEQQHNSYSTLMLYEVADMILDAPAVDAAPVRHGRWIVESELEENPLEYREYDEHFYAVCSECGRIIYLNDYVCVTGDYKKAVEEYPYCHCGAKMDGET